MDNIYVLVAATPEPHFSTRAWGWFETPAQAEECLRNESNDLIFESGTFQYGIIEEVPSGFMGGLVSADFRKTWWFRAEFLGHESAGPDYRIHALEETPEGFKGIVGFGMG